MWNIDASAPESSNAANSGVSLPPKRTRTLSTGFGTELPGVVWYRRAWP